MYEFYEIDKELEILKTHFEELDEIIANPECLKKDDISTSEDTYVPNEEHYREVRKYALMTKTLMEAILAFTICIPIIFGEDS